MVRNKKYSLVAKSDGSSAKLTRYKGPFDGEKLEDSSLSEPERAIKEQVEATLSRLAKTRLSSVSQDVRAQAEKAQKKADKKAQEKARNKGNK